MTGPDLSAATDRLLAGPYWGRTVLTDPAWRKAWDAAPRHLFVPDVWWTWDGNQYVRHDRGTEPDAWVRAVEADEPVTTQLDGGIPSCSNSMPSLVAAMLDGLDVADGMTVFESGTGTGWTAALLSARLGDATVASVEYDAGLLASAAARIDAAGFRPLLVAGDGTAGWPDRAPFDRVSATHSVSRIPAAWIAQTRPGGLVCTPLRITSRLDAFVRLTVAADGSASGPVLFPVAFMTDRANPGPASARVAGDPGRPTVGSLDVPALADSGDRWILSVALPGLIVTGPTVEDGDDTVWLQTPDGSWAVAYVPHGASWDGSTVEQHGPRDLWTVAESSYTAWLAAGKPALDRYGLTVSAEGTHTIWLDEPGSVVSVLC